MTFPVSDSLNAGNWTTLTSYSANWQMASGTMYFQGNAVTPGNGGAYSFARWQPDTPTSNAYAEVTVSSTGAGGSYVGPGVRISTGAAETGYGVFWNGTDANAYLRKVVAGTPTTLQTFTKPVAGSVIRLEVRTVGADAELKVYDDGLLLNTTTDSTSPISSGNVGLAGFGNDVDNRMDNFAAGDLSVDVFVPFSSPYNKLIKAI
jgi:hypothetical protein